MNKKLFLEELRKRRAAKKWSQSRVGKMIGVGQNTFSRIENGISDITIDKVETLCEIFEIDLSTLDKEVTKGLLPKSNSEYETLKERLDFMERLIRQQGIVNKSSGLDESFNQLEDFDKAVILDIARNIKNLDMMEKLFLKAIALKDETSKAQWASMVVASGLKVGKVFDEYYVLSGKAREEYIAKNNLKSNPKIKNQKD